MKKTRNAVPKVDVSEHVDCPIKDLISRIGDKWSMLVLVALSKAPNHCLRFSEKHDNLLAIECHVLSRMFVARLPLPEH